MVLSVCFRLLDVYMDIGYQGIVGLPFVPSVAARFSTVPRPDL